MTHSEPDRGPAAYVKILLSFPRKRESTRITRSARMDSRFRGNDRVARYAFSHSLTGRFLSALHNAATTNDDGTGPGPLSAIIDFA